MIEDATQDLAALYVLGLLDPEETRAFESRLRADAELARLTRDLGEVTAGLVHAAVPVVAPPLRLREAVLSRVRGPAEEPAPAAAVPEGGPRRPRTPAAARRRPSFWSEFWAWGALSAGLAAALVVVGFRWNHDRTRASREGQALRAELARARDETQAARRLADERGAAEAARARDAVLAEAARRDDELRAELARTQDEARGYQRQVTELRTQLARQAADPEWPRLQLAALSVQPAGTKSGLPVAAAAAVLWDNQNQKGVLTTTLPAPGTGRDYQLWVIDPGSPQPVSAGLVPVPGTSGPLRIEFRPEQKVSTAAKFAVSLERRGGAPKNKGPLGPIVLLNP